MPTIELLQNSLLQAMDVFATPVAEIENLFVLPDVFSALAQTMGYAPAQAADLSRKLCERILAMTAGGNIATFALRL